MRDRLTPEQRAELQAAPRDGYGQWSLTDLLLATVADRIAQQTWVLGQWKTRPPAPRPIPRPGVDDASTGKASTLAARLAAASPKAREAAEAIRAQMNVRR